MKRIQISAVLALLIAIAVAARADNAKPGVQQRGRLDKQVTVTVKANYLLFLPAGLRQGAGQEVAGHRVPARQRRARGGSEPRQIAWAGESGRAEKGFPVRGDFPAMPRRPVVAPARR